jgi:serine/threonine-protein kinase RsbW
MTRPREYTHDYPGCLEAVGEARAWVAGCLAGCPMAADAVLCTSEAAGNAVKFTRSAGGKFTVRVQLADPVRVEVADQGGPAAPELRPVAEGAEGGRGLAVIAALAAGWGVTGGEAGRCVWMEFTWPGGQAGWARVMTRAGWRCQCAGQCGHPHTKGSPDGRCPAAHPDSDLHAIPAWPVSVGRAAHLPQAALIAMCAACHDGRDRRASRRPAPAPAGGDLFSQEVTR